jgi:glycine/D-amino acid oxidase-like deaminating enzyme
MKLHTPDVIIIGGGNIGSATAYGLGRLGASVAVIDEGDIALRSARGNFGLVWQQGKGLGMPAYASLCLEAVQKWPAFGAELEELTGIELHYRNPGGLDLCHSEDDCLALKQEIAELSRQAVGYEYDAEFLDRDGVQALFPKLKLGPNVLGGSFGPNDGHVNPLRLLRALHAGFQSNGGSYFPGNKVSALERDGENYMVHTGRERFSAPKIVVAAGLGLPPLAAQLGMNIPVKPQRGQILVSERVRPLLDYPMGGMRQTEEGSLMFGASYEDVGYDNSTTADTMHMLARRACNTFPALAELQIIRVWGALRPLTPDKKPVYEESQTHPGAFALSSHSGVSLASVYAQSTAKWILTGQAPDGLEAFHSRRFHVQAD